MDNSENKENKGDAFIAEGSEVTCFLFEWFEVVVQSLIFVVFMLTFFFRLFTVQGSSMLNTLHNGDKLFVWRYDYKPTNGDIVVIKKFGDLPESIVKRVIATENQSLYINFDDSSVYVDGKKISEPYIKEPYFSGGSLEIPEKIPEGYCFVMGDNRNNSTDSRELGIIKNESVLGKAVGIYFPFHRIRSLPTAVQNSSNSNTSTVASDNG